MRSTAKCVLPVFVGPRTAMSREASPRAGERFMSINVADADASRKPQRAFHCAYLPTPVSLFFDMRGSAPLLPLRAGGANLNRTLATAIGGKQNVSWASRRHGPCRDRQALRGSSSPAICGCPATGPARSGRKARPGSPPGAISSGRTSPTTGCCASSRNRARCPSSGRAPTIPTATQSTTRAGWSPVNI